MTQKFDESDMVCSFKTNHVEFESPNEIAWTLDGEFGGSLKKTVFDVMPKAVDFIVRGKKKKS
jgi:diacylglycerol kinase family enzyme